MEPGTLVVGSIRDIFFLPSFCGARTTGIDKSFDYRLLGTSPGSQKPRLTTGKYFSFLTDWNELFPAALCLIFSTATFQQENIRLSLPAQFDETACKLYHAIA